jgi:hypothetical protein
LGGIPGSKTRREIGAGLTAAAKRKKKMRGTPPKSRKFRRIRSISWRENMPNTSRNPLATEADDGFPHPLHLQLLAELASSLEGSRHALLSGDVGQLEQLTVEQAMLWARILPLAEAEDKRAHNAGVQPDAGAALLAAEKRILHLARVQQALLRRAGQRSRILANLLAGTDSEYAPAAQNHGVDCHDPGVKRG